MMGESAMPDDDVLRAAWAVLREWDRSNPGPGCSWDDCCDEMAPAIEALRRVLVEHPEPPDPPRVKVR